MHKSLELDCNLVSLFEGFAESAPEALLQIAIVFIRGKCSQTVLTSIITSFLSLAKCAMSNYLTMPTKGKEVKEGGWKTKLFFVLPCMVLIATPRIICLSILASYLKGWIILVVFLMVLINGRINSHFVIRDPGQAMLGCLANVFCPVVVVEEGSTFFLKSALVGNLTHAISLILLTTLLATGQILPQPCGESQPSIFQCYNHNGTKDGYQVMRCPLKGYFVSQ